MNTRIAVRGIALHDGKLFCVQLTSSDAQDGAYWCLPGGKLEPGEAIITGLEREMLEETGIPAKVGNLLYIHQFCHPSGEALEFFFHIINAEDYLQVDLSKTTHGLAEIAAIDFIDPHAYRILPEFLSTEDLAAQITTSQPPKFFSFL